MIPRHLNDAMVLSSSFNIKGTIGSIDVSLRMGDQLAQSVGLGCKFQRNPGGILHYSGIFTNSARNLITVRGGLL